MGVLENLVKSITPPPLSPCARGWFYCSAVALLAAAGISKEFLCLIALMAYCQAIHVSLFEKGSRSNFLATSSRLAYILFGALSLYLLVYQSSFEYIIYADIIALSALWIIRLATGSRYS